MNRPVIALLTDFGLVDPYVGQMKGVLAGLAPESTVLDISHQVRPFDILQGAFYLAASWRFFPVGTVFVGVVDPGVGTQRRLVLTEMSGSFFLAPDNGLLALVIEQSQDCRVWDVSGRHISGGTSTTFHGRDILAPLAAKLARGDRPEAMGVRMEVSALVTPPWIRAECIGQEIHARVLHVDRFGNCLLNLFTQCWSKEALAGAELLQPLPQPLEPARTYADIPAGCVGMLAGSQGYWELAVNQGDAAAVLGLRPGARVVLGGIYNS